jgi:hypothetical protein
MLKIQALDAELLKVSKELIGGRGWTELEDNHLEKWWGHVSTRVLAESIGRTRNAIIGRAHRLELRKIGEPIFEPPVADEPPPRKRTMTWRPYKPENQCLAPDCTLTSQPGRDYCHQHHHEYIVSKLKRVNQVSSITCQGASSLA